MALNAKLEFGDNAKQSYSEPFYQITDYRWRTVCSHNETRPDGMTRCDYLEFSVVSPGKEDLTLLKWYVDQLYMSGRIKIEETDPANAESVYKEVFFENAVCFAIEENYHIDKNVRRILRLRLAVESLKEDDIVFTAEL